MSGRPDKPGMTLKNPSRQRESPPASWKKSGDHQLRLVVYPVMYRVLCIPGGAGFLHQQYGTFWPRIMVVNRHFSNDVHSLKLTVRL